MTRRLAWVVAMVLVLAGVSGVGAVDRDAYHTFAEVQAELAELAGAHPEIEILTIGASAGDRPLLVARVAAPGEVDPDQRPALFVGANAAGFHNAGTEAALHLLATLTARPELLRTHTVYVAPVLNPDAHDALFATPRRRVAGNAQRLDHDVDGLVGEDGFEDLNGDGMITALRIADPEGRWQPHPEEPRLMVEADPLARRAGGWRLETEGRDDDRDGTFNEDPAEGVAVDRNFPHAFTFPDRAAGPFPGYAPEAKAVMDFLLAHRNVGLAVVYGPANHLLAAPAPTGGGGDLGSQRFKVPSFAAEMLGFDPDEQYTLDEVWAVAKDLPFVQQNKVTKEQMAQFLGAGPATKLEDADAELLANLGEAYEKRLEAAGLDVKRPALQSERGGLAQWLYYQYGVHTLELDVWGVPAAQAEAGAEEEALTVDALEEMSPEDFLALGEERIAAFLEAIEAPPQFSAAMVIQRVESGQVTPKMMAGMIRQMGGGAAPAAPGEDDAETERRREVLAWAGEHAPHAIVAWTPVTLTDGTAAEVGGLDPFVEVAPPMAVLEPALAVHTETVLDLVERMAAVEVASLEAEPLGAGVYRVRAVARNRGFLPTHSRMAVRAEARLPVRLRLLETEGVELLTGRRVVTAERLDGTTGTLAGEWLVRARDARLITVEVVDQASGRDERTVKAGEGV